MAGIAFVAMVCFIITPLVGGVILAAVFGGWTSVIVAVVSWLGLVALFAIFLRFALRGWRPIRALIGATGRLADGDYSARVKPTTAAPLREVVRSFNRMAERLESGEEARRRLLADVGHELRTPLTIVRGEIEAMADGVHELDESRLRLLLGDLAVMERLLDDLRTLSTAEAGTLRIHREPTDIRLLAAESVNRLGPDALATGVTLMLGDAEPDAPLEADVDPVRVREILDNLIANGIRATAGGGLVSVSTTLDSQDLHDHVIITVVDDGVGIPEDQLEQVFDRFNKGPSSAGSGLGLTISRNLVEAHGGEISLTSTVGSGTTVTVVLPPTPEPAR